MFCLVQQKSQISKLHIFQYGRIYYTLCNTQFRAVNQHSIFKTAQFRDADFLIQSKGIQNTDISASILLRYPF